MYKSIYIKELIIININNILNNMTEDEKESLVQGVELRLDYYQNVDNNDYKLYLAIIESRNNK